MLNKLGFPMAGFIGAPDWVNRWHLGTADDIRIRLKSDGLLQLRKQTDTPRHLVLNASPSDLHQLGQDKGVAVQVPAAFTTHLNAKTSEGTTAQLAIHEFTAEGSRNARWSLANRQRGLLVLDQRTTSLVIAVRVTGVGIVTIQNLEFNPFPGPFDAGSGLETFGSVPVERPAEVSGSGQVLGALMSVRRALFDSVPLTVLMSREEARSLATHFIAGRHLLEAQAIVGQFVLQPLLSLGELRKLFIHGRRTGYAQHALSCIREIASRTQNEKDRDTRDRWHYECQFYKDPWSLLEDFPKRSCHDPSGPVLHIVGKSLPETQTGFTLRTKYTVDALRRGGINSVVAVQSAGNDSDGLRETTESSLDGTTIVQFQGQPPRQTNRKTWLRQNAHELHSLVARIRPSVIHAHSDFTNGVLATHVGEASAVPVVYESRGFWEETWLSRVSQTNNWEDLNQIVKMYGYPDLYTGRRNCERLVRERADRIITLAHTMKEFILEESPDGAVLEENIHLARNAVNAEHFPIEPPPPGVRAELGLDPNDLVIGYISSMVEYEGIETLLAAYSHVRETAPNARLLLVGGGGHLEDLIDYAAQLGLRDVIFTGRVPHEEILQYYHAIDIFVVPRRRTRVTDLVTPLKPFEAFSTGRPVVLSDVAALKEIADDSNHIAQVFRADDAEDLADKLGQLIRDKELRTRLGSEGAAWVRRERSWDSNFPTYATVYGELTSRQG